MFRKVRRIQSVAATALTVMIVIGLLAARKPTMALLMDYVHWRANQIMHELVVTVERFAPHLQIRAPAAHSARR